MRRPAVPGHHARRLRAQLLGGPPASDAVAVAEHLLAVQAQDPRGFRLAVRARTRGLSAKDIDRQLDDGRLVVAWLNRGTLHLVTAEDYWWLHPLTTPQLRTGSTRRLREEGVDAQQAARGADVVASELSTGPRTRAQLRAALDAAGVPTGRPALVHVLMAAALDGLLVRGPVVGREQAFVDPTTWLGRRHPRLEKDQALRLLTLRYLRGHGPAEPADLARWAGIPLGSARRGGRRDGHRPGRVGGPRGAGRCATPAAPPAPAARRLRPAAARLVIARRRHRSAHRPGHGQRAVPSVRPRRWTRGGHLVVRPPASRPATARAARPARRL